MKLLPSRLIPPRFARQMEELEQPLGVAKPSKKIKAKCLAALLESNSSVNNTLDHNSLPATQFFNVWADGASYNHSPTITGY